jgi:predicted ferric reductase
MERLRLTWNDGLMVGAGFAGGLVLWMVVWPLLAAAFNALLPADTTFFWLMTRASGITAYLLLTASMLYGLGVSSRLSDTAMPRASSFALHEITSWLALGFTALHAGVLLFDRYQPFSLVELLVPFAAAYRPVATALGIFGLYTALLVSVTFYLKPLVSHRAWQIIHYVSFGTWVMALAHGLLAGSDTGAAWMQWLYLGSGAAVLLLTLYRILASRRQGRPTAHRTAA